MGKKLGAIFFDAGNTLVFPLFGKLVDRMASLGYPVTAEEFFKAERIGKQSLDEWLWPQIRTNQFPQDADHYYWAAYLRELVQIAGVPAELRAEVAGEIARVFMQIETWSDVPEGTSETLVALHAKGYKLGVISNSLGKMRQQLDQVGLASHFDFILDSAVVGVEKPDPRIFAMALNHAMIDADETVFIGDLHSTDVGGCGAAGIRGILMDRVGAYPDAECPRITALTSLVNLVAQLDSQMAIPAGLNQD